ncbi:MAG: DUF4147 domain-containing protein [Patescibacteria group bacterium]
MKIKNLDKLAENDSRKFALLIAEAGLEAIDTTAAIQRNVKILGRFLHLGGEEIELEKIKRIFFVGIGKCSFESGAVIDGILGDKLNEGIVLDVRKGHLKKIKVFTGTHPLPSKVNIEATGEIIKMLTGLNEDDLVIFVISGGGSTLLCRPAGFALEAELKIFECLTKKGADIYELNTVRKHLSLARGGNLAKAAYPAKIVSLIFSDVLGDNLEFIASGPTVKDTTTVAEAGKIFEKYNLKNCSGFTPSEFIETPKEDKYFERVRNVIILSNEIALRAMAKKAEEFGFAAEIVDRKFRGEAKEMGAVIQKNLEAVGAKKVLLYGGETTVTLKNKGKGGRNQELALSALRSINEKQIIIALASDGKDNSGHAGALVDTLTKKKSEKLKLSPEKFLEKNNSYDFFTKVGDYLETGDTGSNVSDLIIALNG